MGWLRPRRFSWQVLLARIRDLLSLVWFLCPLRLLQHQTILLGLQQNVFLHSLWGIESDRQRQVFGSELQRVLHVSHNKGTSV